MSAEQIFAAEFAKYKFITRYKVSLQIRDLIVGGIPSDASVIRKWLEARMELDDPALQELLAQTVAERDTAVSAQEKVDILMKSPQAPSVNGFKRNENRELCYEGRCLKAAIKEAINSSFPGTDYFGKDQAPGVAKRKGLMATAVERIFVYDTLISLGVKETEISSQPGVPPAWVEERIKHVMTPQGPKSAISSVEVVHQPTLSFTIGVHDDFLAREAWAKTWARLEDIGIGSDRGRSDGSFDLLAFDRL